MALAIGLWFDSWEDPGAVIRLFVGDSFAGFDPQSVLCDFEKGLHNAISSVCLGHYN